MYSTIAVTVAQKTPCRRKLAYVILIWRINARMEWRWVIRQIPFYHRKTCFLRLQYPGCDDVYGCQVACAADDWPKANNSNEEQLVSLYQIFYINNDSKV